MKVFLSWSGEASKQIAAKLYDWLPMVIQSVQPYMSSESIEKGTRWASSISGELEDTSVGIVILTAENLKAPWIYFEAGALAKAVGDSRLAPLLCGLKPSDIGTPLSQFQVTVFNKTDVLKLLKSINASAGDDALPDARLEKMHNALWDDLQQEIDPLIPEAGSASAAAAKSQANDSSKILEELLVLARQQTQSLLNPEKIFSRDVIRMILDVGADAGAVGADVRYLSNISRALDREIDSMRQFLTNEEVEAEHRRSILVSMVSGISSISKDLRRALEDRRIRPKIYVEGDKAHNVFAASVKPKD